MTRHPGEYSKIFNIDYIRHELIYRHAKDKKENRDDEKILRFQISDMI